MGTNWTHRATDLIDGYGISCATENTGGNCQAVTVRHEDHLLAVTDNGAGIYTQTGWDDCEDPLWWRESTNVTKSVFFGMAQFARISGWQKGITPNAVMIVAKETKGGVVVSHIHLRTCNGGCGERIPRGTIGRNLARASREEVVSATNAPCATR